MKRNELKNLIKEMILNETPDSVQLKATGMVVAKWHFGDARPFGYKNGKMRIGDRAKTHHDITNIYNDLGGKTLSRKDYKYSGRLWMNKKIISFWDYPPFGELKKVLADIEKEMKYRYGVTINLSSYKMDIPAGTIDGDYAEELDDSWGLDYTFGSSRSSDKPVTYKTATNQGAIGSKYWEDRSYLYSVKNVLKPNFELKGQGTEWKRSEKVIQVDKDIQHQIPAMLRKGAADKLSPEAKKDLWNYFKRKGSLSKDEKRMWNLINKQMKESLGYNLVDMINEYYRPKVFTLEEGTGILTEAPHVSVGEKVIDLEFERGKIEGFKRIVAIIIGKEVVDKYGNRFKLTSPKEIAQFISVISRNSQVKQEL
jgi:hypothetical protein